MPHDGTLPSPAGDIAPTGRPVAVDHIHVLRYRDGKHIAFKLLFDRLQMLEQLGLIPAPASAGLAAICGTDMTGQAQVGEGDYRRLPMEDGGSIGYHDSGHGEAIMLVHA